MEHRVRRLNEPPTEEDRILAILAGECLQWTTTDELGYIHLKHTLPCPEDEDRKKFVKRQKETRIF